MNSRGTRIGSSFSPSCSTAAKIDGAFGIVIGPPIVSQQFVADKTATGWAVQISFPRTDAISLADGEVEFALKAESFGAGIKLPRPFEVRKTFSLKRMLVSGQLEL